MSKAYRTIRVAACLLLLLSTAAASAENPASPTADELDALIRETLSGGTYAGCSVAVVKDGQTLLAGGYGYADLENDVAATKETVYRLGSITKQFTAMAVMQLVEAGKVALDDELTEFLPDYPTQDHPVTVHQLLNHTSGIKSYTSLPGFWERVREDLSHDDLLAMFKDEPFDFPPGEKWQYSNSGYYLLGVIVEKASGQSYAEYVQEHILRPLAMTSTRYGDMRPLIKYRAQGYAYENGSLVNAAPMSMNPPGAAGGLVSTVVDLVKWHLALEEGKLLSAESYEKLYAATTVGDGSTIPYGYGWGVDAFHGHRRLSHGGGINGFATMIARYPEDRLAVIVLANAETANASGLEAAIARRMLAIEDEPVADLPIGEELLGAIPGTYRIGELAITITAEEGRLFAQPEGQPKGRLLYQGESRFIQEGDAQITLEFHVEEGRATSFSVVLQGQTLEAERVGQ